MSKSPLVSITLRWGLIAGCLAIVLLVASYYFGHHPFMTSPFFDFRILLFGVITFFALREYREGYQKGALYFWQGMAGSFVLIMIAATVSSTLLLGFVMFEDEFVSSYVRLMTDYLKTFSAEDIARIGKEVYERNLEQLPSTNGKQLAGLYFVQSLMIGFFESIILSVILRKQPKPD